MHELDHHFFDSGVKIVIHSPVLAFIVAGVLWLLPFMAEMPMPYSVPGSRSEAQRERVNRLLIQYKMKQEETSPSLFSHSTSASTCQRDGVFRNSVISCTSVTRSRQIHAYIS